MPRLRAVEHLIEYALESAAEGGAARGGYAGAGGAAKVTRLGGRDPGEEVRQSTGIGELDRVLGGGLVEGSVVLIGGDPGIGKSTLLLQAVAAMEPRLPGLYVTGEESLGQVSARAARLGLALGDLRCLTETCVERILPQLVREKPRLVVIDSIQTMYSEPLAAAPGSVSPVRESAAKLVRFAKETGTAVFPGRPRHQGGRDRGAACSSTWSMRCSTSRARAAVASACCAPSRTVSARSTNWACSRWATPACAKCPIPRPSSFPAAANRSRAAA